MIHDAKVEVTCDNDGCQESVFVELEWVYFTRDESSGHYEVRDFKIEEKLVKDHGWVVHDEKHFCDPGCAPDPP